MKTASAKAMSKNPARTPHGGGSLCPNSERARRSLTRGGRPESESDTPVNIENRLYRDNGEGVARRFRITPLQPRTAPRAEGVN